AATRTFPCTTLFRSRVEQCLLDPAGPDDDAIGFDQRVHRVGTAGLALAQAAVAGVDDHRGGAHAIAHGTTGASTFGECGRVDRRSEEHTSELQSREN